MSKNPDRNVDRTWTAFYSHYGFGPWTCEDCHDVITKIGVNTRDGNIHHIDFDVTNDFATNLVVLHTDCHQRRHPISDEMKKRISEKLKGRPSPTKGMKFPNRKFYDHSGENNSFYGRKHTDETRQKMSGPRKRIKCDDCNEEWSILWFTRHKKEGKCIQRKVISINGVSRVRGKLAKSLCADCGRPYASRWMQRHKDEGRCIKL